MCYSKTSEQLLTWEYTHLLVKWVEVKFICALKFMCVSLSQGEAVFASSEHFFLICLLYATSCKVTLPRYGDMGAPLSEPTKSGGFFLICVVIYD